MSNTQKCGLIALIGRANTGKSTLLNTLVGEKISIVTPKPQTTRSNILGVLTNENNQFIFTDTPGLHKPNSRLGDMMVKYAYHGLDDCDIAVLVALADRAPGIPEKLFMQRVAEQKIPCIVVLNKSDVISKADILPVIDAYAKLHDCEAIIPLSAMTGDGCIALMTELERLLPEGAHLYQSDAMTDSPESVMVAEFVREKLMRVLEHEVPHGIACKTERFVRREDGIIEIDVLIICDKQNHKNIIIGKQGSLLKRAGIEARLEIEKLLDSPVFLSLWVKVKSDWKNSPSFLAELSRIDM